MNNITRNTNPEKLFPLVVIDTETTGFQASKNDIIEVAAIKFEYPFSPVSAFSVLAKPRGVIPADASAVNGITDEMVRDCPYFGEIVDSFSEFINGCNIVGHNLPFDLKFLFVGGLDLPESVKYYDTLDLAKKTLIREGQKKYDHHAGRYVEHEDYDVHDYKLETLCEYYGIYRNTQHRALSDVYATAKVFKCLIADKTKLSFSAPTFPDPNKKPEIKMPEEVPVLNIAEHDNDSVESENYISLDKSIDSGVKKKNRSPGRVIVQLDDNKNTINKFDSVSEASRTTGINQKSIRDAASGVQKHAGGFVWKYADELKSFLEQ